MEIENVTLGRHIDRLEEAGWVERRRDPADRRAWRLYLDEKARPIIDRLNALSREVREEALAGIPPEERERSEEHTSELQSLMRISYAVFCLRKKKTNNIKAASAYNLVS